MAGRRTAGQRLLLGRLRRLADVRHRSLRQLSDRRDANSSADCARVAVELPHDYWSTTLPKQSTASFSPEQKVETFTGSISTGCGQASADVGPFYCPADQTIYLGTTFFEDVLQGQLRGPSGAFVEPTSSPTSTATTSRTCSAPCRR